MSRKNIILWSAILCAVLCILVGLVCWSMRFHLLHAELPVISAQGVAASASPGNGFWYGCSNPYRILLSSSGFSLPTGAPVGQLHLTLSVEVVPSGYHLVANQFLADRVDLFITPADTETTSACRYVCDLTAPRLALDAIC